MEDNSDVDSDGSDIDIGNFDENDNANDDFELREVNRNADEWLEAMFDSDSDNDMEFEGFQEDWPQNNFASRLPSRFKLIGIQWFNTQRKQRPIIIMNCSGVTNYGKNWWMKQTGTPNKSAERTPLNRRLQNGHLLMYRQ
jgi:hypothetical protein